MFDIANQTPDGYKVFGSTRTTRHKSPGAARSPCWRTTASAADAACTWRTTASAADAACSATASSWGRGGQAVWDQTERIRRAFTTSKRTDCA